MADRPRLLDLFCGAGGAAMGYHRAGFDVVGIDIHPMPRYPFEFHQADALEYLAEHGREFDAIHASPPCQKWTGMRNVSLSRWGHAPDHPDLIEPTRRSLLETGKIYVIENVQFSPLCTQFILCGHSFGLRLARHRHFEASVLITNVPPCTHRRQDIIGVYGERPDGRRVSQKQYRLNRIAQSLEEGRAAMGIGWMTWPELTQAIPPAYTEFIGKQLVRVLCQG